MSTAPTHGGIVTNVAMPQRHRTTASGSDGLHRSVTQMGALARQLLASPERGTVLAVLSGVAYLRTAAQELLWLACGSTPMHRRCVSVGGSFPRLQAGAPFYADECGLKIAPGVVLDSSAASLWQPRPVRTSEVVRLAELPGRVRAMASVLDCAKAPGLGRLIPLILGDEPECANLTQDRVLQWASPKVLGAARAFREGQREQAALCIDALVGLGQGLTPSGDDFLGGLLFGAYALRTAYPSSRFMAAELRAETYRARTHPVSWALLDDHSQGHALAPLHDVVNGILEGTSMAGLRPAVRRLVRVGHSTGWDMLAGLLAGLRMADGHSG